MGSSAKGTNGQVQYNDGGATAGAEVYYDKATGKLELPGELRTVDGAGNNRLWGKGRPDANLMTHTDPNGYCTTSTGINFALSAHLGTWNTAAEVCPAGTWVCTSADLPEMEDCPHVQLETFSSMSCAGTTVPTAPVIQTELWGWLADSTPANSLSNTEAAIWGKSKPSTVDWVVGKLGPICEWYRVWCCWE